MPNLPARTELLRSKKRKLLIMWNTINRSSGKTAPVFYFILYTIARPLFFDKLDKFINFFLSSAP